MPAGGLREVKPGGAFMKRIVPEHNLSHPEGRNELRLYS